MKKYLVPVSMLALLVGSFASTTTSAYADNGKGNRENDDRLRGEVRSMENFQRGEIMINRDRPALAGSIVSVNGSTLIVSGHAATTTIPVRPIASVLATTTYTVDISNAVIVKNQATTTVSALVVGNFVMVQGTLTGTNAVATRIVVGDVAMGNRDDNRGKGNAYGRDDDKKKASSTAPIIKGNGQPVIGGKVTAINGSSMTLTNAGGTTYTVDISAVSSSTTIVVGNSVLVQGTINGTSVTASAVFAGDAKATNGNDDKPKSRGFFGGIKHFFSGFFGF
ncbi:MAG: hypothetical protein RIT04_691 [Candidatus Parcubacteria bacterium]|jgi:hypothetical protein